MLYRSFQILIVPLFLWTATSSASATDLDVSELIASVKQAITLAQKEAKPPSMVITWVELEISYVVKKEGGGGLKLYVVTAEGKYSTEVVQRMKYRLEPTHPIQVKLPEKQGNIISGFVYGVDVSAGKIFISMPGDLQTAVPLEVGAYTKITDEAGEITKISDIDEGDFGIIRFNIDQSGALRAESIDFPTVKAYKPNRN